MARHASEILEQFELVLDTVSMEQAEREEGPIGTASAAQAQPAQDGDDSMSDPSMDGKLG